MDDGYVLVAASSISAGIAVCLAVLVGMNRFASQTKTALLVRRIGVGRELRILQEGIPVLHRFSSFILSLPSVRSYIETLCRALGIRGFSARPLGLMSCFILMCMVFVGLGFLFGRVVLGVLLVAFFVMLGGFLASHIVEVQQERMRDALPDALQSMSSCFGVGFTLLQTFEHLGTEIKGPLGSLFARAAQTLHTGASIEHVLMCMRQDAKLPELSFVSVALAVQHQTGGSMQRVLDATRASLKEEIDLKRSMRVHTAQAKLSARVVVGVTFGLVVAMMLLSRDFLRPFFSSMAGIAMFVAALILQVAGILAVRSMLKLEVD